MRSFLVALVFIVISSNLKCQEKLNIWSGVDSMKGTYTRVLVYPAASDNNNGAAVVICPGGSYHHLGVPHEGIRTAEWFNSHGATAFVLCYRTAGRGYHHPAMIEDLQRTFQLVRENADRYGIDTTRVGAIGFSAGGHLVTMGGAFSHEDYLATLGITTDVSLGPDWVAAIYPVVSMQDSIAHKRSRMSLLGKKYTKEMQDAFSMELRIGKNMPPTYVQASDDDNVVDVRNSIALYKALKYNNIKCHFEHFAKGGHGYGMKDCDFARESGWQERLNEWLVEINVFPKND